MKTKLRPSQGTFEVAVTQVAPGGTRKIFKQRVEDLDVPELVTFINRPHAAGLKRRPDGWHPDLEKMTKRK